MSLAPWIVWIDQLIVGSVSSEGSLEANRETRKLGEEFRRWSQEAALRKRGSEVRKGGGL